jgi:hypothetical protein
MVQDILGSKLPSDNKYGQNGFDKPSETKIGSVSAAMKVSPQDPVLASIAAGGVGRGTGDGVGNQTRDVGLPVGVPATYGMKGAAPGPTIPPVTGYQDAAPVRKPS